LRVSSSTTGSSEIGLANFEFPRQLGARPFREGPMPLLLNHRQTRASREAISNSVPSSDNELTNDAGTAKE
jgi:hypothetical protein